MAARNVERRVAERRTADRYDQPDRAEPRLDAGAGERKAGFYEDIEGHRQLMSSLGADFGHAPEGILDYVRQGGRDAVAGGRWPLHRTVLLVAVLSVSAWSAIVGIVYALV